MMLQKFLISNSVLYMRIYLFFILGLFVLNQIVPGILAQDQIKSHLNFEFSIIRTPFESFRRIFPNDEKIQSLSFREWNRMRSSCQRNHVLSFLKNPYVMQINHKMSIDKSNNLLVVSEILSEGSVNKAFQSVLQNLSEDVVISPIPFSINHFKDIIPKDNDLPQSQSFLWRIPPNPDSAMPSRILYQTPVLDHFVNRFTLRLPVNLKPESEQGFWYQTHSLNSGEIEWEYSGEQGFSRLFIFSQSPSHVPDQSHSISFNSSHLTISDREISLRWNSKLFSLPGIRYASVGLNDNILIESIQINNVSTSFQRKNDQVIFELVNIDGTEQDVQILAHLRYNDISNTLTIPDLKFDNAFSVSHEFHINNNSRFFIKEIRSKTKINWKTKSRVSDNQNISTLRFSISDPSEAEIECVLSDKNSQESMMTSHSVFIQGGKFRAVIEFEVKDLTALIRPEIPIQIITDWNLDQAELIRKLNDQESNEWLIIQSEDNQSYHISINSTITNKTSGRFRFEFSKRLQKTEVQRASIPNLIIPKFRLQTEYRVYSDSKDREIRVIPSEDIQFRLSTEFDSLAKNPSENNSATVHLMTEWISIDNTNSRFQIEVNNSDSMNSSKHVIILPTIDSTEFVTLEFLKRNNINQTLFNHISTDELQSLSFNISQLKWYSKKQWNDIDGSANISKNSEKYYGIYEVCNSDRLKSEWVTNNSNYDNTTFYSIVESSNPKAKVTSSEDNSINIPYNLLDPYILSFLFQDRLGDKEQFEFMNLNIQSEEQLNEFIRNIGLLTSNIPESEPNDTVLPIQTSLHLGVTNRDIQTIWRLSLPLADYPRKIWLKIPKTHSPFSVSVNGTPIVPEKSKNGQELIYTFFGEISYIEIQEGIPLSLPLKIQFPISNLVIPILDFHVDNRSDFDSSLSAISEKNLSYHVNSGTRLSMPGFTMAEALEIHPSKFSVIGYFKSKVFFCILLIGFIITVLSFNRALTYLRRKQFSFSICLFVIFNLIMSVKLMAQDHIPILIPFQDYSDLERLPDRVFMRTDDFTKIQNATKSVPTSKHIFLNSRHYANISENQKEVKLYSEYEIQLPLNMDMFLEIPEDISTIENCDWNDIQLNMTVVNQMIRIELDSLKHTKSQSTGRLRMTKRFDIESILNGDLEITVFESLNAQLFFPKSSRFSEGYLGLNLRKSSDQESTNLLPLTQSIHFTSLDLLESRLIPEITEIVAIPMASGIQWKIGINSQSLLVKHFRFRTSPHLFILSGNHLKYRLISSSSSGNQYDVQLNGLPNDTRLILFQMNNEHSDFGLDDIIQNNFRVSSDAQLKTAHLADKPFHWQTNKDHVIVDEPNSQQTRTESDDLIITRSIHNSYWDHLRLKVTKVPFKPSVTSQAKISISGHVLFFQINCKAQLAPSETGRNQFNISFAEQLKIDRIDSPQIISWNQDQTDPRRFEMTLIPNTDQDFQFVVRGSVQLKISDEAFLVSPFKNQYAELYLPWPKFENGKYPAGRLIIEEEVGSDSAIRSNPVSFDSSAIKSQGEVRDTDTPLTIRRWLYLINEHDSPLLTKWLITQPFSSVECQHELSLSDHEILWNCQVTYFPKQGPLDFILLKVDGTHETEVDFQSETLKNQEIKILKEMNLNDQSQLIAIKLSNKYAGSIRILLKRKLKLKSGGDFNLPNVLPLGPGILKKSVGISGTWASIQSVKGLTTSGYQELPVEADDSSQGIIRRKWQPIEPGSRFQIKIRSEAELIELQMREWQLSSLTIDAVSDSVIHWSGEIITKRTFSDKILWPIPLGQIQYLHRSGQAFEFQQQGNLIEMSRIPYGKSISFSARISGKSITEFLELLMQFNQNQSKTDTVIAIRDSISVPNELRINKCSVFDWIESDRSNPKSILVSKEIQEFPFRDRFDDIIESRYRYFLGKFPFLEKAIYLKKSTNKIQSSAKILKSGQKFDSSSINPIFANYSDQKVAQTFDTWSYYRIQPISTHIIVRFWNDVMNWSFYRDIMASLSAILLVFSIVYGLKIGSHGQKCKV